MAKHITEKRKKRKLVVREESSDSDIVPETPLGSNSPKVSTPLVTSSVPPTTTIIPITTIPLEIVVTKSVIEEVPISNCRTNVSDMGVEVNLSVDPTKPVYEGIPISIEPVSSTFISPPPFLQHISTSTTLPTFDQVLLQPITTLSQS